MMVLEVLYDDTDPVIGSGKLFNTQSHISLHAGQYNRETDQTVCRTLSLALYSSPAGKQLPSLHVIVSHAAIYYSEYKFDLRAVNNCLLLLQGLQ